MIKVIMRLQPKITCVIRTHCDGIQPTDSIIQCINIFILHNTSI